jgi:hypothetical protein
MEIKIFILIDMYLSIVHKLGTSDSTTPSNPNKNDSVNTSPSTLYLFSTNDSVTHAHGFNNSTSTSPSCPPKSRVLATPDINIYVVLCWR